MIFTPRFTDTSPVADHPDREHATAVLRYCTHTSSSVITSGQRSSMLADAAQSFEKLGDARSLKDCRNMMNRLNNMKPNQMTAES